MPFAGNLFEGVGPRRCFRSSYLKSPYSVSFLMGSAKQISHKFVPKEDHLQLPDALRRSCEYPQ